jgi:hypothetical protein
MHIRNVDQLKYITMNPEIKNQIEKAFGEKQAKRQKYNNTLIYLSKCCNSHTELIAKDKKQKIFKCLACGAYCETIFFRSKWESQYYQELLMRVKCGDLESFDLQKPFKYADNGEQRTYYADFVEYNRDGSFVVVDTKGKLTKEYIRTKKLIEMQYEFKIIEKYRR